MKRLTVRKWGLVLVAVASLWSMKAWGQELKQPQTTPQFVLKAGATGTAGGYLDALYFGFKNAVEKNSNGRIRVDLYLGSALGGERELLEMVQQGTADVTLVSNATYSIFDPKWAILDMPYFFVSKEDTYRFLDGEGGKLLAESMLKKGIRVLAFGDGGFRQVSNNKREVAKLEDLKGLKIRVAETPALMEWFRLVGAGPTVLAFPELYPAMQQGVVDGQENGMVAGNLMKFGEVQKFWTDTNHALNFAPIGISEIVWKKLPPDLQKVVADAAVEATNAGRKAISEYEAKAIKDLQAAGVKVTLLSDKERERFVASAKPVYAKFAPQIGVDFMNQAFALLGRNWK